MAAALVEVVVRAVGYKNSRSHADTLDDTLSRDKRITHSYTAQHAAWPRRQCLMFPLWIFSLYSETRLRFLGTVKMVCS